MANALFDFGRNGFLDGSFNWMTSTINAVLVRTVAGAGASGNPIYTASLSADQFLTAVPNNSYCRPIAAQTLGSKSATAGVANAAAATFPTVAPGDAIQAVLLYYSTGTDSTSRLIAYIDTATNLPITPNGGDINVNWDTGPNKIFKL